MKKFTFILASVLFAFLFYAFNQPKIDNEIFDPTGIVAPNAKLEILGEGYSFTEGPAVDKKGNVFFTDQPNDKIIQWSAKTKAFTTFSANSGGRANGMYFDAAGNLITCADMDGEIWRMDKKGNHKVIAKNYEGKILNGPNDLWINPKNGGIYITDPRYKRDYWAAADPRHLGMQQSGAYLYYLGPNSKTLKRLDENLIEPNGIVGSPDGKKLYVGNIKPDITYVYDIMQDGSLSNRQVFCKMKTDGMTIDEQGNIYLTNSLGVTAFNQKGERIFNVPTGESWTANVVFGGENRDLLFITAMGRVFGLKMKVKGVVK